MAKLKVLVSAEMLSKVMFKATIDSPARFRFTFTSRLQNLSLEVIDNIYRANDAFGSDSAPLREAYQRDALSNLRTMQMLARIAQPYGVFTGEGYSSLNVKILETAKLLKGWMGVTSK